MAHVNTVVKIDNRGRLTIPEPVREKLGLNDMKEGEKRVVGIDIEYNGD